MSQFDTKFTKQTPVDSPDDSCLSESVNQIFSVRFSVLLSHDNPVRFTNFSQFLKFNYFQKIDVR